MYYEKSQLNIELYTDAKDFSLEERIKMALEKHGLAWQKEEEYIESEKMYEAIFEVEV